MVISSEAASVAFTENENVASSMDWHRWVLLLGAIPFAATGRVHAHYQMLLPSSASGVTEQAVTITYQWGHPFEHQLFDAPVPAAVGVVAPDGTRSDLSANLQKIEVRGDGDRPAGAFRITFTPRQRGDHVLTLTTAPIWMNEEKLFLQDTVKTVYHVQTQNGWDRAAGLTFEIMPMTRPYGLTPGMAFQGQALADGKPLAGALVEVERYNPSRPKVLPADEQITRGVKCDPNGIFTCTLTESGWWCFTAARDGDKRERDGKLYPVKQRATLWVFVDEKAAP